MNRGEIYTIQVTEDTYITFAGDGNAWRYVIAQHTVDPDGQSGVIDTMEREAVFPSLEKARQDAWKEFTIGILFPMTTHEGKRWIMSNWGENFNKLFAEMKQKGPIDLN